MRLGTLLGRSDSGANMDASCSQTVGIKKGTRGTMLARFELELTGIVR